VVASDPAVNYDALIYAQKGSSLIIAGSRGNRVGIGLDGGLDKLEDLARAGKISRLHDNTVRFSKHFAHGSIKGMTDADRLIVVNLIDEFLAHFGQ
jgi:hypothetical protein